MASSIVGTDFEEESVQRYSEALGTDTVTIEVGGVKGTKKVKFVQDTLCQNPVFEKLFKGGFAEATTQCATFPDDDPDAFQLLITWTYTGNIANESFIDGECVSRLRDLFFLADKYDVRDLMDRSIDRFIVEIKERHSLPDPSAVRNIYDNTHSRCKLRLFFSRVALYGIGNEKFGVDKDVWSDDEIHKLLKDCSELGVDVVWQLRGKLGKKIPYPWDAHPCHYHQHSMEEACPHGGVSTATQIKE